MPPKGIEVVKGRNNRVFTWGSGFMGQLGHGDRSSFDWPRDVQALDGVGIIQMAAGPGDHCVGLTGASTSLFAAPLCNLLWRSTLRAKGLNFAALWQALAMFMRGAAVCVGSWAMGRFETRHCRARCDSNPNPNPESLLWLDWPTPTR